MSRPRKDNKIIVCLSLLEDILPILPEKNRSESNLKVDFVETQERCLYGPLSNKKNVYP